MADLEQRRDRLDANTVLLVDEAGMVGTRKLARLLDYAHQAEAKVILIGDDRQLSSMAEAGTVRERMGHGSLAVTSGYMHRVSEADRAAAEYMGALLDRDR